MQAVITGLGLLWLQEALPLSVGGETGSATQQASPLPEASQDHRPLVCWEQSQGQNCALERTLLSLTLRLPRVAVAWPGKPPELWKVHGTPDDIGLNIFPYDLLVPPAKPLQSPGLPTEPCPSCRCPAKLPGHLDAQRGPE